MSSSVLLKFFSDTNIHGCGKFMENSKFRRCFWVLIVITSFCIWMSTLIVAIDSIYKYQVKTVVKYENKKYIQFPILTICSACPVDIRKSNFSKAIQDSLLVNSEWLLLRGTLDQNTTMDRKLFTETYSSVKITLQDILLQARWNNNDLDIFTNFQPLKLSAKTCFQFNGGTTNRTFQVEDGGIQAGLEIIADTKQTGCPAGVFDTGCLQVYVHVDEEFSELTHILLSPGVSTNIGLTKSMVTYLPRPYKAIGGRYCNNDPTYSRSKCVRQCIEKILEEKCPCYITAVNFDDDKEHCDPDYTNSYKCIQSNLRSSNRKAEKRQLCTHCPDQCVITHFKTDLSYTMFPSNPVSNQLFQLGYIDNVSYARENLLKFNINFKTMYVLNVQHEAIYTMESVMGTVGGQIGFYLGASVLSSIEILQVMYHYGWSMLKKLLCLKYESKTKVQPFVQ